MDIFKFTHLSIQKRSLETIKFIDSIVNNIYSEIYDVGFQDNDLKKFTRMLEMIYKIKNIDKNSVLGHIDIEYASGDDIDNVTQNVTLTYVTDEGVLVIWESDKPLVISPRGKVIQQPEDETVTLTAHVYGFDEELNKEFILTVKAEE